MADYENQDQTEYKEDSAGETDGASAAEVSKETDHASDWQQQAEREPQPEWQQNPWGGQQPGGPNGQYPFGQPYNGQYYDQTQYGQPYGSGQYNNGQYGNGPYYNGQYGGDPYNNGQYGNGPYNNGPYGNAPYNNGPYNNQPYNNTPYGAPYGGPQKPPKQKNTYATISFISSLCGLLVLCCGAFPLSIILGVGAIGFAIISKKGQPFTGLAIAGIILGALCIFFGVLEFVYAMIFASMMQDPEAAAAFNEVYEQMQQIFEQK